MSVGNLEQAELDRQWLSTSVLTFFPFSKYRKVASRSSEILNFKVSINTVTQCCTFLFIKIRVGYKE